jgi:hypothetical protein
MIDTIVDEIRKAREEYARKFNFDLQAMGEDLRRRQKLSSGGPLVSFPKRPPRFVPSRAVASDAVETDGTQEGG